MGLYSKYCFPRMIEWSLGSSEHSEHRALALAPASGQVLEIGFGTGLNLPHYPPAVTRLTAVDPERMLQEKVQHRIARAAFPVELFHLDAGGTLPFDNATFDTVVTTWTLCSIAELGAALSEIRRVLKPGGSHVFLEPGRSNDPRTAKLQDFFNPVNRVLGRGCHINRAIDKLLEEAGLQIVQLERYRMPKTPRIFGEMYRGVARNAAVSNAACL